MRPAMKLFVSLFAEHGVIMVVTLLNNPRVIDISFWFAKPWPVSDCLLLLFEHACGCTTFVQLRHPGHCTFGEFFDRIFFNLNICAEKIFTPCRESV